MLVGCGIGRSPIRFKIDLKPKNPLVFAGKSTDDIAVWVKQVSNFLTPIGGQNHIQVAYAANLLQGVVQDWFQWECDVSRCLGTWGGVGSGSAPTLWE